MAKLRSLVALTVLGLVTAVVVLRLSTAQRGPETPRYDFSQVQTWQLSGWRELGGARVPWEIAYQRSPQFYRESQGQELLLLSDESSLRVFAPREGYTRPVAFISNSRAQAPTLDPILPRATAERDARTQLPTHFRWVRTGKLTGELQARYNQPLTLVKNRLPLPKNTLTIDLTRRPPFTTAQGQASASGLTVRGEAWQDPKGTVKLELRYWLGDQPVGPELPLRVAALIPDLYRGPEVVYASIRDEHDQAYRVWGVRPQRLSPPARDERRGGRREGRFNGAVLSGVPLLETNLLQVQAQPGKPLAAAKSLRLPLDLGLQRKPGGAASLKTGFTTSVHLDLTVPVQRSKAIFPLP